jgi:hypothetical protein
VNSMPLISDGVYRGILHEEAVFPKPMEFIPERYLEEIVGSVDGERWRYVANAVDPRVVIFGYGRR